MKINLSVKATQKGHTMPVPISLIPWVHTASFLVSLAAPLQASPKCHRKWRPRYSSAVYTHETIFAATRSSACRKPKLIGTEILSCLREDLDCSDHCQNVYGNGPALIASISGGNIYHRPSVSREGHKCSTIGKLS